MKRDTKSAIVSPGVALADRLLQECWHQDVVRIESKNERGSRALNGQVASCRRPAVRRVEDGHAVRILVEHLERECVVRAVVYDDELAWPQSLG